MDNFQLFVPVVYDFGIGDDESLVTLRRFGNGS